VKTKTRGARIDVDDVSHDALTIVVHFPGNIATKPHSTCTREVSKGTKMRLGMRGADNHAVYLAPCVERLHRVGSPGWRCCR
jgi:hypothetical protein